MCAGGVQELNVHVYEVRRALFRRYGVAPEISNVRRVCGLPHIDEDFRPIKPIVMEHCAFDDCRT
jgi:hypothetical protein